MIPRFAILAASLLATPAMAADQFDLVCKGETRERVHQKWSPADFRYRIDLASGRWCSGTCDGTSQIAQVTDGQLTLADLRHDRPYDPFESHWIDRRTGDLHYLYSSSFAREERQGKCEAAPFSGFPTPTRKF